MSQPAWTAITKSLKLGDLPQTEIYLLTSEDRK